MNLRQLYFRNNECYKVGRELRVQGIMVHSTGANNPNLRRYVGPDDGQLGHNPNNNHWNVLHPDGRATGSHRFTNNGGRCGVCGGRQVCVHAWIGKLANGRIATYQSLPWDMRGWHCGGHGNDTHIGFEICEDNLGNREYFDAVYKEAVELSVHLCKMFHLDPLEDGVLIDHAEGHRRGIAGNHRDVGHWFSRHGKSMDTLRADVAELLSCTGYGGNFPIEEGNLQAMVNMGVIGDPTYWRNVASVRWLNELMAAVARAGGYGCLRQQAVAMLTPEEAVAKLVEVGVIGSPDYWLDVLETTRVRNLGRLLVNMANAVCGCFNV